MEHLKSCSRSNVIYNLAKALGKMRDDHSDSLLPTKRIPMGLVEHCVNFCSSHSDEVQVCVCTSIANYDILTIFGVDFLS